MRVIFHPRTEWTDRLPDYNSGAIRPKLQTNRPYFTIHYTGSPWHRSNGLLMYPPVIGPSSMVHIEAVADASLKSFEYNYVIPVGANGDGHVWEYAGDYQAAHSAGENHLAIGVLLLLGVDFYSDPTKRLWQPCSDEIIYAVRWLRKYLLDRNILSGSHLMLPHKNMPGAATVCPGDPAMARWSEFLVPFREEPTLPTPIGEDVKLIKCSDEATVFIQDGINIAWIHGPDAGNEIQRQIAAGTLKPVETVSRSYFSLYTLVGDEPTTGLTKKGHFSDWRP